jgi:hypothetical protein
LIGVSERLLSLRKLQLGGQIPYILAIAYPRFKTLHVNRVILFKKKEDPSGTPNCEMEIVAD